MVTKEQCIWRHGDVLVLDFGFWDYLCRKVGFLGLKFRKAVSGWDRCYSHTVAILTIVLRSGKAH